MGDFDDYLDDDYVEPAPVPYARRAETALKHADHWAPESLAEEAAVALAIQRWRRILDQLEQLTDAVKGSS